MKQILHNLRDGTTIVENVPIPTVRAGQILVRSLATLISAGTEKMLVDFGNASYINKARQQPEKVREVIDKIQTDGLIETIEAVTSKLDQPLTTGYCNVGIIAEIGSRAGAFSVGQRVVSNGNHAEFVSVPSNLCAPVPDNVSDDQAAFVVLASIGLQGIRLVNPTIGENIVVTGLGLIGLLTVQILRAQGCRVLGIDVDSARLALAKQFGADVVDLANGEDPISAAAAFSRGQGVDAVLITASTRSNEPVSQAARMCRKRGRIVLVGVTGLELSRADFYEKELTFQVSCSYGPGRYDPEYEEKGHDYPIGFVRWTEQRNFEAVLDLMSTKAIDVEPLISHRYSIDSAEEAYKLLSAREPSLGILLEYDSADGDMESQRSVGLPRPQRIKAAAAVVGIIGAGNYAGRVLIPAFKKTGASLHTLVSNGGVSGVHYGKKYGFSIAATDPDVVFDHEETNVVVVATRHDSHARYVVKALEAGKHVFVEKPLAITNEELDEIDDARCRSASSNRIPLIMLGFNRRFAPFVQKIKRSVMSRQAPISLVYTCNAGHIDSSALSGRRPNYVR
jgi:threonine dehydrogenase-like Zn-dependent dehydrogenase